ncbi:hypothetical protein FGRMN_4899 [Fusarium graminum]|nr:hypothetical protein FGRMN_4899 [Fusarium graminum]
MSRDQLQQTRYTYLFGYPLKHSLAPLLHSTIFKHMGVPWTYRLIESIDKGDFLPKLKASDCIGAAEGRAIGAINTVYIRTDPQNGKIRYISTNTDCVGVRETFLQEFPNVLKQSVGKPALVIGGGGACRSAVYALHKWLGASEIYLVNRLEDEALAVIESFSALKDGPSLTFISSLEQAKKLRAPVLVVGTVPDIPPRTEGEIVAQGIVQELTEREEKGYVLEMCYHPNIFTSFYRLAEDNGWKVIPGTVAMVHQGIAQEVLWMERSLGEMPLEAAKTAIAQALEAR